MLYKDPLLETYKVYFEVSSKFYYSCLVHSAHFKLQTARTAMRENAAFRPRWQQKVQKVDEKFEELQAQNTAVQPGLRISKSRVSPVVKLFIDFI